MRRALLVALLVATCSAPAFLVDDPAPRVPADLSREQCSPAVPSCLLYRPVVVSEIGVTVDCGHPRVWCDDEGA